MKPSHGYPIPAQSVRVEQVIKRSRFVIDVGHAVTRAAAIAFIEQVRTDQADARHHCWAYVAGHPDHSVERASSDDGEPQGTAGKPMLNVLQHKGIGEIVVVVSRYFGGIKLGAGGLVRAYSSSVQQGVDALMLMQRIPLTTVTIRLSFAQESQVRHLLEQVQATIQHCDYGSEVTLIIETSVGSERKLKQAILNSTQGAARVTFPVDDAAR
ncbi:MAG: YigZ family protein [Mariprofundaceae bacterium]|nr:YigZ family protein [Mariprofundaceae bacterium]